LGMPVHKHKHLCRFWNALNFRLKYLSPHRHFYACRLCG
jgi:hypothetical protein